VLAQSGIRLKEINVIFGWGIRDVMIHGQGYLDIKIEALIRSNQQLEKINMQSPLRLSVRTLCNNPNWIADEKNKIPLLWMVKHRVQF
jgi:hypothetical protein